MIKVRELLVDNGVRFTEQGKNCTPGWVNIQCVYCADRSNHLGINLKTGSFNCWKCHASGNAVQLLQDLLDIGFNEARQLTREYKSADGGITSHRMKRKQREFHNIFPKEATDTLPAVHREYLIDRRFDPALIASKYHVKACHMLGKYKWRLLVPVLVNGVAVSFVALSVAGAEKKAVNLPNDKSVIDIKDTLYNLDNAGKKIVVCEGVKDVWRIGDGAVATFGTQYSTAQIALIVGRKPDAVFVMYDSDAVAMGYELAEQLSGLVKKVEVIELDEGDPEDLTEKEAIKLRRDLGL